jgi:aryl-alcohol dehydrogenase-like predicted oxidoreductase
VVAFTAGACGKLVDPRKMPPGEPPPSAADAYRFALSNAAVDVCMVGARTVEQMREDLAALDRGPLDPAEMARMRRIGDHIYGEAR